MEYEYSNLKIDHNCLLLVFSSTVVREISVIKNIRTRACVRKLNVRNVSSQYIKYACYYGKRSPVVKYFDTKIF